MPELILPNSYKNFASVFDEQTSEQISEYKLWDHAIDLKPGFILQDCKIYLLSSEKTSKMNKFINNNLWKEYIWSFKSPQASSFFFVSKKDSNKLQLCQDYK